MSARRIAALLNPSSVAIVGASVTPGTYGDLVRRNLGAAGFRGKVYLVNPGCDSLDGERCYRSVLDVPGPVDLAVLLTPAAVTCTVLAQCGEKGVRGAIVAAAGFREGGAEGAALERELVGVAQRCGIRFLGPNSLGLIRTDSHLNAACGPPMPQPGRLALVSQSGALCSAMLDWAETRGVGFSTVIATGFGVDVDCGEILDFLARDGATDSIMLYLERIADARGLMSALRAAARVKPVVVMKAGRAAELDAGPDAPGRAADGSDAVFDAAMRRAGVLRIHAFQQLYSAAGTLATGARLAGRRLAIVTNAGGPGQLAADRAADRGLQLAWLAPSTLEALQAVLPPSATHGNPVHVRSDASAAQFGEALRLTLADPKTDALLAVVAPFALSHPDDQADALIGVARSQRKPVFTCWMGDASMMESRRRFAGNRIPTYRTPEAAVDAIAALALFTANQEQLLQVPTPLGPASAPDRPAAQRVLDAALAAGATELGTDAARQLLVAFDIAVNAAGHPAAAASDGRSAAEFRIGVERDPVFGPTISCGLGGEMAEIVEDRALALPPLNPYLARDLVRRTRANAALQRLGGGAPQAVERLLLRVSEIVCELPDLQSLDLDPVRVTPHGAVVSGACIRVERSPPGALPYRHMAIHPYPSGLEGTLELPGGEVAVVRPIRPEDAQLERDFIERLSEESRYLRFMFGLHALTPAMLSRFTQIDYDRELALILVRTLPDGEPRQIGVARYITLPDGETCEFAIVVADEWQGKGVARGLFTRLIDAARRRRLRVMTGITLRENARMIDLARALGFAASTDGDEPELVRMTLAL